MTFESKFKGYLLRGRSMLNRLCEVQQDIPERRFKGGDVEDRVLVPVTTIYADEEKGKLPVVMERDDRGRRKGYTLKEINILQEHYGTSPRRQDDDLPVVLSFINQKGGCWKSTTATYAGSRYANLGYRVALVDLDPQATITENFGFQPNIRVMNDDTLASYITEEDGFDDEDVKSIVLDTHIENLKLIPSCLHMGYCDIGLTKKWSEVEVGGNDPTKSPLHVFTRVRQLIDIIAEDFDIVILDGTPSLGLLPINIVLASDIMVVPVPTESCDFAATLSFVEILLDENETLHQYLSPEVIDELFPEAVFVPTRYSSASTVTVGAETMLEAIRETFGEDCSDGYIRKHDGVVSNLSMLRRTVFDVNSGPIKTSIGDINIKSDTRKRAINNYSEVFDQLLNNYIKRYWPSREAELNAVSNTHSTAV